MAANVDAWTARIAAALCVASRWQAAGALLVTLCALLAAVSADGTAFAALALAAALCAAQLYLAVRIELDRAIFTAAAQDGFEGFDEALARLGWRRGGVARSTAERASGLAVLVKANGALLLVQLALLLSGLWLR